MVGSHGWISGVHRIPKRRVTINKSQSHQHIKDKHTSHQFILRHLIPKQAIVGLEILDFPLRSKMRNLKHFPVRFLVICDQPEPYSNQRKPKKPKTPKPVSLIVALVSTVYSISKSRVPPIAKTNAPSIPNLKFYLEEKRILQK